jgi:hypothetical protein
MTETLTHADIRDLLRGFDEFDNIVGWGCRPREQRVPFYGRCENLSRVLTPAVRYRRGAARIGVKTIAFRNALSNVKSYIMDPSASETTLRANRGLSFADLPGLSPAASCPTGSRPSAPIISSAQARVGSVLERDRVIVFAQEIQQRWWRSDALIGSRKARPQRGPLLSV